MYKNIIKLSGLMSGFNNRKNEFNYSLFSTDGNLVSTDTRRMMIIEDVRPAPKENMLLKCSKISSKIETYCNCMVLNTPARLESEVGLYPDYKRVIPKNLKDIIYLDGDVDVDELLFIIYNQVAVNHKFILDLFKVKNIRLHSVQFGDDAFSPFVINGEIDGHKFKYIIMPLRLKRR